MPGQSATHAAGHVAKMAAEQRSDSAGGTTGAASNTDAARSPGPAAPQP